MPNARIIRAVLFAHPEVSTLTIKERYLLIGLTSVANDWGKLWYHTGHIRSQVFPLDEISLNEINEMLDNIASKSFFCIDEVGGVSYAHFPTWYKKGSLVCQRLDHPRADIEIPDCPTHNKDDSKKEDNYLVSYYSSRYSYFPIAYWVKWDVFIVMWATRKVGFRRAVYKYNGGTNFTVIAAPATIFSHTGNYDYNDWMHIRRDAHGALHILYPYRQTSARLRYYYFNNDGDWVFHPCSPEGLDSGTKKMLISKKLTK